MSDHEHDPHATDEAGQDAHDAQAAQAVETLGPIDWPAWGMAVIGGALALLVALTLVVAAHP